MSESRFNSAREKQKTEQSTCEQQASLLETKLFILSIRLKQVDRPRLIEQLNRGLDKALILVSAPAGYGKTTLISSWLHRTHLLSAWGAFFIWWGITELFPSLPEGIGAVGIGLILLGLNMARSLNGMHASGFTTTLGILAFVLGGLELAGPMLRLPFELPVFAVLLIVLGLIFLGRELMQARAE